MPGMVAHRAGRASPYPVLPLEDVGQCLAVLRGVGAQEQRQRHDPLTVFAGRQYQAFGQRGFPRTER